MTSYAKQAKLNALSPMPDNNSETQRSCEFDFSALALPVPLEFADTDSLQDVSVDVFDEDLALASGPTGQAGNQQHSQGGESNLTSLEPDEEPAEVEVKPILPGVNLVSVVVEPPSSEENSSQAVRPTSPEDPASTSSAIIAGLGERIVEGAEEPVMERTTTTGLSAASSGTCSAQGTQLLTEISTSSPLSSRHYRSVPTGPSAIACLTFSNWQSCKVLSLVPNYPSVPNGSLSYENGH